MIDYKPKHKRPPAYAGSTPRGPERWARAAHNALTRPNSQAAKLYHQRVANARYFAELHPEATNAAAEFMKTSGSSLAKRKYVTCSLFCTVMVAQLDWGTTLPSHLRLLLENGELITVRENSHGHTWKMHEGDFIRPLARGTLSRPVQCYYCGTQVKR